MRRSYCGSVPWRLLESLCAIGSHRNGSFPQSLRVLFFKEAQRVGIIQHKELSKELVRGTVLNGMVLDTIKTKKVGDSIASAFILTPQTMEICNLT